MSPIAEAWARLGIPATDDKREVKRAYGRALKAIDPETDPQSFLELREAYDAALQWGTATPYWEEGDLDELLYAEVGDSEGAGQSEAEPEDEDWWERWRPEPPAPEEEDGLREACARLDRLLFDDPPPSRHEIVEAGSAVLDHPRLAEVDRLTEVELWIAEIISAARPRSDALIDPALARFGWNRSGSDWRRHEQVGWVLERRDGLAFLKRCSKPDHSHFRGLQALTEPPPAKLAWNRLDLAGDVRDFLEVVEKHHPTLEQDMNPESLEWWRAYLHGRHLSPNFLIWMLAGPPSLTLVAAFLLALGGWPAWSVPLAFPLAVLAILGGLLGKAELDARARQRRAAAWDEERLPSRGIERIAVAALLLPPLAALLPNGPGWTGLSITASLALAAAGLRLGWVGPGWETSERTRLFLPIVAGVVGGTILASAPGQEAVKLAPPILVLAWLGSRGYSAMQLRFAAMARTGELKAIAASLLCVVVAGGLTIRMGLGGATPPWAMLLVPSAIVGGHLATAGSAVDVHYLEWPLRVVGAIVYFATGYLGEESFWLRLTAATSAYALLYVGTLLLSAIGLGVVRMTQEHQDEEAAP